MNRTGLPYHGSYDIWTRNHLAALLNETQDLFIPQPEHNDSPMAGWVNGNEYERSTESFGILPLSESSRAKLGMLGYHNDFALNQKILHRHLAQQQQTRMAVLPVHTPTERALYRMLVKQDKGLFSGKTQPNWIAVAAEWSKHCDGIRIFYKVRSFILFP
jgi:hypothetical protein